MIFSHSQNSIQCFTVEKQIIPVMIDLQQFPHFSVMKGILQNSDDDRSQRLFRCRPH